MSEKELEQKAIDEDSVYIAKADNDSIIIVITSKVDDNTTIEHKEVIPPDQIESKFYMMEVVVKNMEDGIKQIEDISKGTDTSAPLEIIQAIAKNKENKDMDKKIEEAKERLELIKDMRKDFIDFISAELPNVYENIMKDYDKKIQEMASKFDKDNHMVDM